MTLPSSKLLSFPADQAVTEKVAAERLGLKTATLRAWRHRGRGPTYVRLGRAVRYLPSDLDQFLRRSRVDCDSAPQLLGRK